MYSIECINVEKVFEVECDPNSTTHFLKINAENISTEDVYKSTKYSTDNLQIYNNIQFISKMAESYSNSKNLNQPHQQNPSTPIVFRSLNKDWPAINDPIRKWNNFESLLSRAKSFEETSGKPCVVDVEVGESYMDPSLKKFSISMSNFIPAIQTDSSVRVYLAQFPLDNIPFMREDVILPSIIHKNSKNLYGLNIWFSGLLGSKSPCHYDPLDNLLCQVFGEKEVLLFDPKDSSRLYPKANSTQKNTSLVDIDNPNLLIHPLYREIKGFHTTLSPDDFNDEVYANEVYPKEIYMAISLWKNITNEVLLNDNEKEKACTYSPTAAPNRDDEKCKNVTLIYWMEIHHRLRSIIYQNCGGRSNHALLECSKTGDKKVIDTNRSKIIAINKQELSVAMGMMMLIW
eukprot:gene14056-18854_t